MAVFELPRPRSRTASLPLPMFCVSPLRLGRRSSDMVVSATGRLVHRLFPLVTNYPGSFLGPAQESNVVETGV